MRLDGPSADEAGLWVRHSQEQQIQDNVLRTTDSALGLNEELQS
jgi:hypothetical protein